MPKSNNIKFRLKPGYEKLWSLVNYSLQYGINNYYLIEKMNIIAQKRHLHMHSKLQKRRKF